MSQNNYNDGIFHTGSNYPIPSHMNFGRFFVEKLQKLDKKVALINGVTDERITYNELVQQIVTVASSLSRHGVKQGDVVALCSENRFEFIISSIATLYIGAVTTYLNVAYSKDEIVHTMNISKPKYAFVSSEAYKIHYETFKNHTSIKEFFVYGDDHDIKFDGIKFSELCSGDINISNIPCADFYGINHTALILYSSGTTGLPKGAKITNLSLIMTSFQKSITTEDLPFLTLAPWCNTLGLLTLTHFLMAGKTVLFIRKFEERLYLQVIQKYKVGVLLLAPPTLILMSKSSIVDEFDVSSVKYVNCGGAPLDSDVITQVKNRFPNLRSVLQGYGMTEASGSISKETDVANKQGSVGRINIGIIMKIVDVESRKILGPNKPGEICIKGLSIFDGYFGRDRVHDFDEDDFFKTGDIGYHDDEGYLYIIDRIKELIKYKAWQVSPSELEAILILHPAVKDAAVIGTPDPIAGELPTAFITKKPGYNVTEKEIIDFTSKKVSPWKRLRGGVKFIDQIPKNGSGKILRRILRDMITKKPVSKL